MLGATFAALLGFCAGLWSFKIKSRWEQVGDCADTGDRQIQCAWSEPTRWWPRLVRIVFLRPAEPGDTDSYSWPENTFLVIGSAPSGSR